MEWIKCSDRLPEPYKNVAVFDPSQKDVNDQVSTDYLFNGVDKLYWNNNTDTDTGKSFVTHWMPLPKPPKP